MDDALELVDEVQLELVENPVLEEVPEQVSASPDPPEEPPERDDPFRDIDYESYFQDVDGGYVPRGTAERGEDLPSFENVLTRPRVRSIIWSGMTRSRWMGSGNTGCWGPKGRTVPAIFTPPDPARGPGGRAAGSPARPEKGCAGNPGQAR